MRAVFIALLGVAQLGCATSNEPSLTPTQTPISITSEEGAMTANVRVTRDVYVSDDVLIGERLELWRLIPTAYEALGLPLPEVDRAGYSASVKNHVVTRNLHGERLSNFLECGSGIAGANADSHRVRLSVRTWIADADSAGRSVVRSNVEATAQNAMHGSSGTTHCSSRGRLEMLIREELRKLSVQQRLESVRRRGAP